MYLPAWQPQQTGLSCSPGEPHEIEQYLPPAADIDWTLTGIEGYDYPDMSMFCGKNASNMDARSLLPGFEQYESLAVPATAKGNSSSSSSSSSSKPIKHRKQQQDTGSIALRVTDYKSDDAALRRWIVDGGLQRLNEHQFITVHTNQQINTPCPSCPKVAGPAPKLVQNQDGSRNVDRSAACLYRHLFGLRCVRQTLVRKPSVLPANRSRISTCCRIHHAVCIRPCIMLYMLCGSVCMRWKQ